MDLKTENQLRQELAELWALLRAERDGNAALRKDAERYRWLAAMFEERRNGWWIDATHFEGAPSLETLDDTIDAAMAR